MHGMICVFRANGFDHLYESRTGVMYLLYRDFHAGGLTVMYGEDGLPLTYEKWKSLEPPSPKAKYAKF